MDIKMEKNQKRPRKIDQVCVMLGCHNRGSFALKGLCNRHWREKYEQDLPRVDYQEWKDWKRR
jgi:hypothetical protein